MSSLPFVHGIVTSINPDDLERAVASIQTMHPYAIILDNSRDGWIGKSRKWPIPVVQPSVPLSWAQSLNFMNRTARDAGQRLWTFQHDDAFLHPGEDKKFLDLVLGRLEDESLWCTAFTHYDVLACWNVKGVDSVGGWDWHFPSPNYYVDLDFFRRADLKGVGRYYWKIKLDHIGSNTIKTDPAYRYVYDHIGSRMNIEYYTLKWGGKPGEETFDKPWDGRFEYLF